MKIINRIAIALLLTSLAGVTAFAKTKTEKVSFPTNIKVNGTALTKGEYDLKFDYETGELTIVKAKKVVARAMASVEKRDTKARDFVLRSTGAGENEQLIGITFGGADHNVILNSGQASR